MAENNDYTGFETAVIGMAVRFPGADRVDEFWNNLKTGIESVSFFSEKELVDAGLDKNLPANPHYVKANISIRDKEYFDASFFEYIPEEAQMMNPQTRLFHECTWQALEDAGHPPTKFKGIIGLFAGAGEDFGWHAYAMIAGIGKSLDSFTSLFLRSKDTLCTRISYKLNLEGPSVCVNTACSTALVAIHMACSSLISGECDIAAAGGITIKNSTITGYLYREGTILSPDGHCRAFDARAHGTLSSEGAGVVVLKPLENALKAGDNIYAIIKGSAINNDGGAHKVGYTAPGVKGQAKAIRNALTDADVLPETITYIETHGTGTVLGDPIEIEGLKLVFGKSKEKYCALGSVKTNIGHTDTAAGVAGFIKTVLALKHKQLPPNLHFQQANNKIEFSGYPFYVNRGLKEWKNDKYPLRAGVSSFGIGGTNSHVILEEAPLRNPAAVSREYQLLMFSAKTAAALDRMTENLSVFIENNENINLADAAYTLQVGRMEFLHRRFLICRDAREAAEILSSRGSRKIKTFKTKREQKNLVFMFPGQGSQYIDMGLDLYQNEPLFRQEMDRCFAILNSLLDYEIKDILYPALKDTTGKVEKSPSGKRDPKEWAETAVNRTEITQPLLFIFEYSLAKLLMSWGIKPDAMIGHSIGEYTAAHLAGVFTLEDALTLVTSRGKLMQQLPTGSMISVLLSEEDLLPLLKENLDLAAVNSISQCVVSGPHEAVTAFEKQLREKDCKTRRLHTSHAFHSGMMEPMLAEFTKDVKQVTLNRPEIPYISCVSGNWIRDDEAVDPKYWVDHLRSTVRFSQGLDVLSAKKGSIFVEVGAGKALSNLIRQKIGRQSDHPVVNLVRNEGEAVSDLYYLLERAGRLWLYGKEINWRRFYEAEQRYKVSLPTYPFEKIKYPCGEDLDKLLAKLSPSIPGKADISDSFYVPSWRKSILLEKEKITGKDYCNLVFLDKLGIGSALLAKLSEESGINIKVSIGEKFVELSEFSYEVNPESAADFKELFRRLHVNHHTPDRMIHLWSLTGETGIEDLTAARVQRAQITGFYSLLNIAGAAGQEFPRAVTRLFVFTDNMQDVNKMDIIDPGKSTITGAIKVIPQEYTNILCRSIDVVLPGRENIKEENLINLLYDELNYKTPGVIAAYRGLSRWEQTLERVKLAAPREQSPVFKEKGVYLITGGLGGIGLTFSEYLGRNYKARLILTGRSFFPGKNEWQQWILDHKADDAVSKKILMFREWENAGAEILYLRVDIADASGMEKKISEAEQYFGVVNGIIHAAGILDYGGVIHNRGKDENEKVFAAKIYGTLALNDILQGRNLDFFVLCSSISAILPSFGEVGYASANGFLDAFARYRMIKEQSLTISINWSIWNDVGMGYRAYVEKNPEFSGNSFPNGINPREGVDIMLRSVRCGLPQLVVSAGDLNSMLENHKQSEEPREKFDVKSNAVERDRPDLLVEYTPPGTVTQEIMARIWGDFFGIKEIGIDDDFFELGGDSLKAMNLSNQMYRKFKVDIPLVEFFNKPAIRELALFIEAARGTGVISLKSVEKKDYYALSASQKRLYLLHNLGDRDYEISNQFEFGREINKEKWDEAFKILISRQESLRTSFRMAGETPVQVIHERGEVDFSINYYEEIKLNNLDEAIRIDKIREDFQQPFDLGKAPLIRIWQVKNVNNKYTVFFKIHHIITDALSNSIIMDEVYSIYSGQKTHPLPIQYKDFSEWQYRFLKSGELKRQEDYWLREFAGRKPQLKLPLDYDRTGEHGSGSITSFIRKDEAKKTDDIKKEQGVTMFMVMLAVYDILLAKLSGQEDIIVGTFTNGRDFAYLEKIVGMLVKTIVLRNRPAEDLTFREFLVQLKEKVLNAFKNQDYPFDRLVEKLHVDRQTGRNPLFDVAFNYFSNTDLESSREQKEDKKEINYAGHSLFDLVLVVYEQKDSFELIFSYDSRLFEQTTIERYVAYFKEIYAVVTNDPGILLGEIKISHRFAAAKSDIVADEKFEFNF